MTDREVIIGDYRLVQDETTMEVTIWIDGRPQKPVFTGLERAMLDRIIHLERELGLDLI